MQEEKESVAVAAEQQPTSTGKKPRRITYKVDKDIYHIPQEKEKDFLEAFGPSAQRLHSYEADDGEVYNIPAAKEKDFLAAFPNARRRYMDDGIEEIEEVNEKKKGTSGQKTEISFSEFQEAFGVAAKGGEPILNPSAKPSQPSQRPLKTSGSGRPASEQGAVEEADAQTTQPQQPAGGQQPITEGQFKAAFGGIAAIPEIDYKLPVSQQPEAIGEYERIRAKEQGTDKLRFGTGPRGLSTPKPQLTAEEKEFKEKYEKVLKRDTQVMGVNDLSLLVESEKRKLSKDIDAYNEKYGESIPEYRKEIIAQRDSKEADRVALANYMNYIRLQSPKEFERMALDRNNWGLFNKLGIAHGELPEEKEQTGYAAEKAQFELLTKARNHQKEIIIDGIKEYVPQIRAFNKAMSDPTTFIVPNEKRYNDVLVKMAPYKQKDGTYKDVPPEIYRQYQEAAKAYNEMVKANEAKVEELKQTFGVTDDVLDMVDGGIELLDVYNLKQYNTKTPEDGGGGGGGGASPEIDPIFFDYRTRYKELKAKKEARDAVYEMASSGDVPLWAGMKILIDENFINPVLSSATSFLGNVMSIPKSVTPNTGYGWTDRLFDFATEFSDFYDASIGLPSKLDKPLFDDGGMNVGTLPSKLMRTAADFGIFAASGGAAGAPGIFAAAYAMQQGDNYREAIDGGLTHDEAVYASNIVSIVSSLSELAVRDDLLFREAIGEWKGSIIRELARSGVKKKDMGKYVADSFEAHLVKNGLKEGFEELFEGVNTGLVKSAINSISDSEVFSNPLDVKQLAEATALGFVMGAGAGTVGYIRKKPSPIEVEALGIVGEDPVLKERLLDAVPGSKNVIEFVGNVLGATDGLPDAVRYEIAALELEKKAIEEQQKALSVPNPQADERATEITVKLGELMEAGAGARETGKNETEPVVVDGLGSSAEAEANLKQESPNLREGGEKLNKEGDNGAGAVEVSGESDAGKAVELADKEIAAQPQKLSDALRSVSKAIKEGSGDLGAMNILPKSVAAALDLLADLIDKFGDVAKAIKEFYKSREYTDLSEAEKTVVARKMAEAGIKEEGEIETPDLSEAKGEKRKASRAKRIEHGGYTEQLDSYTKTYESVNTQKIAELVNAFFNTVRLKMASGSEQEVFKEVWEYVNQLLESDFKREKGDTKPRVYTRSAFAMMLAQKMLEHAIATGNTAEAADWNTLFDERGRWSGTIVALTDSGISLDPIKVLGVLVAVHKKTRSQKLPSGKSVGEVSDEILETINKAKEDAIDEIVSEGKTVTGISIETETEKPPQKRRTSEKKTKLRKERDEHISAIKKIRAGAGAGPLMAMSPKNAQLIKHLVGIAKIEIQLGAYTFDEVVSAVYKHVRQFLSKKMVSEALEGEWDGGVLSEMASLEKREAMMSMLADAIAGRSGSLPDGGLFSKLAKAIRMASDDYIGKMAKNRRITKERAVEEIMANEELARNLVNVALGYLEELVDKGKYDGMVKINKPPTMERAEWDVLKRQYIMAQFRKVANQIFEEIKAKRTDKELEPVIAEVAKEYYKTNRSGANTLAEALVEQIPELSLKEAVRIAQSIERAMEAKTERVVKGQITRLIKELTSGNEKKGNELIRVVSRIISHYGRLNQLQLTNSISNYLNINGLPPHVVNQILTQIRAIHNMPQGLARQQATQNVISLVAQYTDSPAKHLIGVLQEVVIRNLLSSPKTGFTGGLSVFLFAIPYAMANLVMRPAIAGRGLIMAGRNYRTGRSAVKEAMRRTFIEHGVPYGRDLEGDSATKPDRAWLKARNEKWRDVADLWKKDKWKGASHATSKLLQAISFQGKAIGIANIISDLASFLDYVSVIGLRDMYAAIDAQRKVIASGMSPKNPQFADTWKSMVGMSDSQLQSIEAQVQAELSQMLAQGRPVPKGYVNTRTRQLISENSDLEILTKAHEQAVHAIGMVQPTTALGATAFALMQKLNAVGSETSKHHINFMSATTKMLLLPLTVFVRMSIVVGEQGVKGVPIVGILVQMYPYRFEVNKTSGMIQHKVDASGNRYNAVKEDSREYAMRIAFSGVMTAAAAIFLSLAWDDEEVLDEEGNPIINPMTGKPFVRSRYKLAGVIDFYGSGGDIGSVARGVEPRNTVRIYGKEKNEDGSLKYTDYPFEVFTPFLYGTLVALGMRRDSERHLDAQIAMGLDKNKDVVTYIKDNPFNMVDLAASATANSWNLDFSGVNRLLRGIESGKWEQAMFDVFIAQNAKTMINPRIASDITRQVQNIKGQHEIYVDYNIADNGVEGLASHLMKDVWFLDPFIADRENYESIDPFGFPIAFPPIYDSFIGSFGTTTTYKMAEHEQKYKEYYNLYKNDEGFYDAHTMPFPKRYIYSNAGYGEVGDVSSENVSVDRDLRRRISDAAYKHYGELIRAYGIDKLASMPYLERKDVMDGLWDEAKIRASTLETETDVYLKEFDKLLYDVEYGKLTESEGVSKLEDLLTKEGITDEAKRNKEIASFKRSVKSVNK